jgi:hypothetical protein
MQQIKNTIASIYDGSKDVAIVNSIDKERKAFKKKDTIEVKKLMSDDYQVAGIQAVPYTGGVVVNFVSKKGDENVWYFNTDICRIEGIGRFYIGLAGHIQILEGDELKKYATEYARKYLIC